MKQPMLELSRSYTFYDYFKLNQTAQEIAIYFGYRYQRSRLALDRAGGTLATIHDLKRRLEENLIHVNLINETARREFLIAPVLSELVHYTGAKITVEQPVYVNDWLQGALDYYVELEGQLLIIEAKNADLQRGFNQLTAELIALDQQIDASSSPLHGAVSIGDVWQFGLLDRTSKLVTQDIELYRVPTDVEELLRILIAIVN